MWNSPVTLIELCICCYAKWNIIRMEMAMEINFSIKIVHEPFSHRLPAWKKLFNKLSLKCCWSVSFYIEMLSYQDTPYFLFLSLCLRLGLCIYYLCNLYLFNLFAVIIFIFMKSNHITSLIQKNLFFWTCLSKVQPQHVA